MKRVILIIALIVYSITAYSQVEAPKYKIAGREIDAKLFQKNLRDNVSDYVDYMGWNQQEIAAFKVMYRVYVDNLTTGRFSTDAFWTITDNKGELDERVILYYDKKGNLSTEKPRKPWYESQSHYERTLRTFIPAKKVATYAKEIGQALIKKLDEDESQRRNEAAKREVETKSIEWAGTGFALNYRYIATNNHVVEDAKTIVVTGINGNFNINYSASVVATDIVNDLAIIRINDSRFNGFGTLPYCIDMQMADVGEDVFVLGYPLTQTMGNEIKLTNGIISSRTGFQGDASLYQMSAPIQPGNSGGPLFDSKGNVIGIVCAHHIGAENVGYAIKTSYLKNLADSYSLYGIFPSSNNNSRFTLSEQVKRLKPYVFLIKCTK